MFKVLTGLVMAMVLAMPAMATNNGNDRNHHSNGGSCKPTEVIKYVKVPVEVIKWKEKIVYKDREVIKWKTKEVPVEVIKWKTKEVPVEVIKEVVKEVPVEVIKEVIKEVPVEVIKYVNKEVVKYLDGPQSCPTTPPIEVSTCGSCGNQCNHTPAHNNCNTCNNVGFGSDVVWDASTFRLYAYNIQVWDGPVDTDFSIAEAVWEFDPDTLVWTLVVLEIN